MRRCDDGHARGATANSAASTRRVRLARTVEDPRDITMLGVEQSNSSVIVGGRYIAKLVRRLEAGLNPDVELPEHLRKSGFDHVPGVVANAVVTLEGEAVPADVVIVHDAIAHESDLWTKVLDDVGLAIDLYASSDFADVDVVGGAVADLLGRRTAELHGSLARPGGPVQMQPEGFTLLWQRSVLQTLRNSIKSTQRELRARPPSWTPSRRHRHRPPRRSGRRPGRAVRPAADDEVRRAAHPHPR